MVSSICKTHSSLTAKIGNKRSFIAGWPDFWFKGHIQKNNFECGPHFLTSYCYIWNFCKVEFFFLTIFLLFGHFWHKICTVFENFKLNFYKYTMPHYYFQMIKSSKAAWGPRASLWPWLFYRMRSWCEMFLLLILGIAGGLVKSGNDASHQTSFIGSSGPSYISPQSSYSSPQSSYSSPQSSYESPQINYAPPPTNFLETYTTSTSAPFTTGLADMGHYLRTSFDNSILVIKIYIIRSLQC